jgi:hypothetical protein
MMPVDSFNRVLSVDMNFSEMILQFCLVLANKERRSPNFKSSRDQTRQEHACRAPNVPGPLGIGNVGPNK